MRQFIRYFFFTLILLTAHYTQAQNKFTINGVVKDASNGETLIGATVYIKELKNGATTNEYGFYSLTLPVGSYTIDFSYVGFELIAQSITLDKNTQLNIRKNISIHNKKRL